ncbi:hypothetical protein BDA99DRAFT_579404 [Phascolomyces articulosus]|uniref:Uncharacterized protein n=1 Tax=Phascolomyces articulosus TaxID=60185 RepID=A0AAD5PEZ6_9FUNG|nr:hypothetical protein BDA99DRAFT_579404 [Phascolomyces articulosus]
MMRLVFPSLFFICLCDKHHLHLFFLLWDMMERVRKGINFNMSVALSKMMMEKTDRKKTRHREGEYKMEKVVIVVFDGSFAKIKNMTYSVFKMIHNSDYFIKMN